MFIDGNSQERPDDFSGFEQSKNKSKANEGKYIVYGIYAFLLFIILFFLFLFWKPTSVHPPVQKPKPADNSSVATGVLPGDPGNENGRNSASSSLLDVRGERIVFADYYQEPKYDHEVKLESYDLPIDVKIDVSNYYELSRKVNLDSYLDKLNQNGFAVLGNQFTKDANDFFAMNRLLSSKEIPVVVTSDLIFYYFQNTLKEVYSDIQQNAFYKNVWDINKTLYDASLARYRKKKLEMGDINDPILEGARLEVAYFAVALDILVPLDRQINKNESTGLLDLDKFNEQDTDIYAFKLPSYLEDDVLKEVSYIRSAQAERKSPVMLYPKNYKEFKVPKNYKKNAKLNNFYLAMKWMNSNFPLYYKTAECPDCLLDKNDWVINMITANYITKDLFANQEAKNQWAVVYKFISFFSGLRSDLTYLHYHNVMIELFGDEYSVDKIFSSDNVNRDENINKIQNKISEISFPSIEGSFDRNNIEEKPLIGMRILQEAYWPNEYVFGSLNGKEFRMESEQNSLPINETGCPVDRKRSALFRCKSLALDLVNIINPVDLNTNDIFARNIQYSNYQTKSKELGGLLASFDKYTNNNNIYWMSLDLGKHLFVEDDFRGPIFMRDNDWGQQRTNNTFLGAWVNLHLPADTLENYFEQTGGAFSGKLSCDMNNYVEADVKFLSEIIARNDMLISMLNVLGVAKTANATTIRLKEFNDKIKSLLSIAKKELAGVTMDNDDCKFLNSFIKHRTVEKAASKVLDADPKVGLYGQSINGVKIVALVYRRDDKLVMAMGPIFNYHELSRKID